MRRLDQNQIHDEFNKQKDEFRTWAEQSGFAQALQDISQVVSDLKASGLDIELEMFPYPSERAFKQDDRPRKVGLKLKALGNG